MKKVLSLLVCLQSAYVLQAQDIHFTQFNMAPMIINPANAGAEYDLRAGLNYRNQWSSVASPFSTTAAAFDMRISKIGDGFLAGGLDFYTDKAGDSKMGTTQGNLSLAYHLKIARFQTLGMGVSTGYAQRRVSTGDLTWGNQYDGYSYNPTLFSGEPGGVTFTKSFVDLNAGIVWTYSKEEKHMTGNDQVGANIGFSVNHIHQPDYSFYGGYKEPLQRKYVFHANALFGLSNSNVSIVPGLMFAAQGKATEMLIGTSVRYRLQEDSRYTGFIQGASLSLGLFYRNRDATAVTAMFQFSNYSIGVAYDINISSLTEASNGRGGFELALRYVTFNNGNGRKARTTRFL